MFSFLFANLKSVAIGVWGLFTLYLVGKNSKLLKQNDALNLTVQDQSKNIEIKKEIIDVIQKTKPTDVAGNVERMRNKDL